MGDHNLCDTKESKPGMPGEVPDNVTVGVLEKKEFPTQSDLALAELLTRFIEDSRENEPTSDELWADLKERLESQWPSLTYNFLGSRIKCIAAGVGVADWIDTHFSAFETQSGADHEIIIAAARGMTGLFSNDGIARVIKTASSLEVTKMEFLGYIASRLKNHVLIHAAGVATTSGGILFVGPSMSGKSTLATQCYVHGCPVMGDDFIAIHKETGELFCFPKSISLRRKTVNYLRDTPAIQRLIKETRISGVIDPRKMIGWPVRPQKVKTIFILKGFKESVVTNVVKQSEVLKHIYFQLVAPPREIIKSARGVKKLISEVVAYEIWHGTPEETARCVMSLSQR
ncbi:MAG: hypothetical protein ACE5IC_07820 [Candidatus Brocadiales bacterium]